MILLDVSMKYFRNLHAKEEYWWVSVKTNTLTKKAKQIISGSLSNVTHSKFSMRYDFETVIMSNVNK